jgi:hypothetical protein
MGLDWQLNDAFVADDTLLLHDHRKKRWKLSPKYQFSFFDD